MNRRNPSLSPQRNEKADHTNYMEPQKRVLIFSSTEGIRVANAVKTCLERFSQHKIKATLWDRTHPRGWLLDHVLGQIRQFPFVVLVLTPDDKIVSRRHSMSSPRDNLLMELGMALATNELDHTFVLRPERKLFKLPTNISGWITRTYRYSRGGSREADVEEAVREFVADILARQSEMSWDLFLQQIEWLNERTNRSDEYEDGLRPHVVIGVNMGGMLAGSLLYYKNRSRFHLMTVWTKDESMYRKLAIRQRDFQEELRQVVGQIRDRGDKPRILLIDDSDKSGEAMNQALQLTKAVVPDACVKTGALVYLGPPNGRPDYCQLSDYQRFKYAPV